jgi:hypothetical protein
LFDKNSGEIWNSSKQKWMSGSDLFPNAIFYDKDGNFAWEFIPSYTVVAKSKDKTMNRVNNISDVVSKITDATTLFLTSTRSGRDLGYLISINPIALKTIKYIKPLGYGAAGISIISDYALYQAGQESGGMLISNSVVTGIALAVGGWEGIAIGLDYAGAKLYLRETKDHPDWMLPAYYRSFYH